MMALSKTVNFLNSKSCILEIAHCVIDDKRLNWHQKDRKNIAHHIIPIYDVIHSLIDTYMLFRCFFSYGKISIWLVYRHILDISHAYQQHISIKILLI